jgi:PTH1 family peptidyl-tRNA hydrolase
LGNPGREYANNRHNVGFWVIDRLANDYKVSLQLEGKFLATIGRFTLKDSDIWLLKPQTFMNLSGKSVLAFMSFYKILPAQILVIYDELDFSPGVAKLKLGGGSGGHNGIKSIEQLIGGNFWRLRIGIGHPGDKNKVASFVLKKPTQNEEHSIQIAIDKIMTIIQAMLYGEYNLAMKQLHT